MTHTASAHAKCLVLGGYAVVERESTALCVALKPRVVCRASFVADSTEFVIDVETRPGERSYKFRPSAWEDPKSFVGKYERFLLAAFHTLFSVFPLPKEAVALTIEGDPEFYTDLGKTGLGSSAAVTVSVVRALCALCNSQDEDLIFRIAAVAHSTAQGSIGSCFDISCAVWGTQIFRRPSQEFLNVGSVAKAWDNEWSRFSLPDDIKVRVLSTRFSGSSTPGMVRRFFDAAAADAPTFALLRAKITDAVASLTGTHAEISDAFRSVRVVLRDITLRWGVEVVPDEVQSLADHLETIDGVIAVVIPGAGGYDSIAVITEKRDIDFASFDLSVLAET